MNKPINEEYVFCAYNGEELASAASGMNFNSSKRFSNYGRGASLYVLNDFFFTCLHRGLRIMGNNFCSGWNVTAMLANAYSARPNGDLWVSIRIYESEDVFICDREFVFGRLVGFKDENGETKLVVEHPCGNFNKLNDDGYMAMAKQLRADFANYERTDEMIMSDAPIPEIWPGAVSRSSVRFDAKHVWQNDNGDWCYGFQSPN